MVVVMLRDNFRGGLYFFRRVRHGDSVACGTQHGKVVLGVSCGIGVGEGKMEKVAYERNRVAFAGIGGKDFQIFLVGKNQL